MKQFLRLIVLTLALTLLVWAPAMAAHFDISVFRNTGHVTAAGGYTQIFGDVQYIVFTAGSEALATIYTSDQFTSEIRNPVSTAHFNTADRIDFWTNGVDNVDVLIIDNAGGFCTWLNNASGNTRGAIIDERPGLHHGMVHYTMSSSGALMNTTVNDGQIDTGIEFPGGTILHDMFLEVLVASRVSLLGLAVGGGSTGDGDTDLFLNDTNPEGAGRHLEGSDGMRFWTAAASCSNYGAAFMHSLGDDGVAYQDGTEDACLYYGGVVYRYLIETAHCLTYSISSGIDGTLQTGTNPGWGFIHYWFTNFRP